MRRLSAIATSKLEGFDATYSFVLAFNTIGWKPSNVLFNAVDALLGDPLVSDAFDGQQPSQALAWIRDTDVTAGGDVTVTATQAAELSATVGNEGVAAAQLDGVLTKGSATDGVSGGGLLASNKVATLARAFIRARLGRMEDVPSPTFTLVQVYEAEGTEIWHADLYRLSHPDEVWELGLDAAFPALFLALLAPLLRNREPLFAALLGAGIALALTPITPAGIPVIAATAACLVGLRRPAAAPSPSYGERSRAAHDPEAEGAAA